MKETLDLVGEADNIEIFTNAKLIENLLPYNSQESHARYSRAIATRFRRLNPYVLPGFLELVKVGVPAKIKLNYSPEKEFKSSIDYIYPALGSETRTTKVRFTIANPGEKIKPNMYTDVEIKISLGSKL
ncbi:MAG: efflux RND transporter periplasmic adaptor subunit, partial [Syntrophales bacterium]